MPTVLTLVPPRRRRSPTRPRRTVGEPWDYNVLVPFRLEHFAHPGERPIAVRIGAAAAPLGVALRLWLVLALGTACSPARDVARPAPEPAPPIDVGIDAPLVDAPDARPVGPDAVVDAKGCQGDCKKLSRACDQACPPGEPGRGCLKKCGCALITCEDACTATGKVDFGCH